MAAGTLLEAPERAISAALEPLRRALLALLGREPADAGPRAAPQPPEVLDAIGGLFGLTPFERDVLLLCAGVELDAELAALCAEAQGDALAPTFSLAMAALPGAHWSAVTPAGPLRRWRLLEVGPGAALTRSPLRISEAALHYLAGAPQLDERLLRLAEPVWPPDDLSESHRAQAAQVAAVWRQPARGRLPAVQLCGRPEEARAVAAAACDALGLRLHAVAAASLPASAADQEALLSLWARDAALLGSALLVEHDDRTPAEGERAASSLRALEQLTGAVLVASRERLALRRPTVTLDVQPQPPAEQRAAWAAALVPAGVAPDGRLDAVAAQFHLGPTAAASAAAEALGAALAAPVWERQAVALGALWDACRRHARAPLEGLAQRIDAHATWEDLVLPGAQAATLREIAAHVRQRAVVYERWGFAAQSARGLGIGALFAGPSGTGKTTAAEVLANELRLDLYRIDLSAVVSKYIGETEKNLRRVFDAAEDSGAILLFDEADALFGKRSDVKDSHDRYANIEVSYLLQRMESYRGLAILTTNLRQSLDQAFLRRIRFVVHFPFPDASQRAGIWRRAFPAATPTEGLDVEKLARLNIAGGNIRTIALNAAFLAADAGEPVRMAHLLRAAHTEYAKLEKPLTDAEVAGWL